MEVAGRSGTQVAPTAVAVAAVVAEVVPRVVVAGTEVSPLDAVAVIVAMITADPVRNLVEVGCQIADSGQEFPAEAVTVR